MKMRLRLYPTQYAARAEFRTARDALFADGGFDEENTSEGRSELVTNDGTRVLYRACGSGADVYRFRGLELEDVYVSPACSPDVRSGVLSLHVVPPAP